MTAGWPCKGPLATKHLLTDSVKFKLHRQVEAHVAFVNSLSEAFQKFKIPQPADYDKTKKSCEFSSSILEFAQETVMVAAAVSIVEEMKPTNQPAAAAVLLQQEECKNLPDTLKQMLYNLRSKKAP